MQGLALLSIYIVVAIAGQVVGYGISSLIDRAAPALGLPVFLAIFFRYARVCLANCGKTNELALSRDP